MTKVLSLVLGQTSEILLSKTDVGLSSVDNTSDVNKPVSTAQQTAMNALSLKNRLINGDFAINQRVFAGGTLAAGVYGFDRWKAGSGGCNVSLSSGVLTHASGPLVQVIETPILAGKTITVSVDGLSGGNLSINVEGVTGTIVAGIGRVGVALTVPSGSTGNVTLTLTPASGSVTYKNVQIELGSVTTAFEWRFTAIEIALCMRYFERVAESVGRTNFNPGFFFSTTSFSSYFKYAVRKRAVAAVTFSAVSNFRMIITGTSISITAFSIYDVGVLGVAISATTGATTAGSVGIIQGTDTAGAAAYFDFDAEL